ncbi:uroporphyrinogen decarboxylase [candidate division KSB1 bacterium]|nr:uroporphyrinogen decarboxylase [candidate division KSB1 bacterium]RQW06913.1 MAG: uroporphyrinogen decarboxylase [candidate division KSB1 bacterium]
MTLDQWNNLLKIIHGDTTASPPIGFIIDSPWLPNWTGITILDYFSNDEMWFKANKQVVETFPEVLFLPGFWSEYGMCTEPSVFGARSTFPANEFPHAHKVIHSVSDIEALPQPNPATDGLLPFMLNRLKLAQPHIENIGHQIRFAVARGPLNIASYLMGTTELLTTMMMEPEKIHTLLSKVSTFLKQWLDLQRQSFASIDGILLLDDIIGFLGEAQFVEFALPYFKDLFDSDVSVKFLHNDAPCRISAPYLPEMGVNLFNMGFDTDMNELKKLTHQRVTLLGNIPPRDVLANGRPEDVREAALKLMSTLEDKSHVIFSCGGGMPPGVSTQNLCAFIDTIQSRW